MTHKISTNCDIYKKFKILAVYFVLYDHVFNKEHVLTLIPDKCDKFDKLQINSIIFVTNNFDRSKKKYK